MRCWKVCKSCNLITLFLDLAQNSRQHTLIQSQRGFHSRRYECRCDKVGTATAQLRCWWRRAPALLLATSAQPAGSGSCGLECTLRHSANLASASLICRGPTMAAAQLPRRIIKVRLEYTSKALIHSRACFVSIRRDTALRFTCMHACCVALCSYSVAVQGIAVQALELCKLSSCKLHVEAFLAVTCAAVEPPATSGPAIRLQRQGTQCAGQQQVAQSQPIVAVVYCRRLSGSCQNQVRPSVKGVIDPQSLKTAHQPCRHAAAGMRASDPSVLALQHPASARSRMRRTCVTSRL